MSKAQDVTTGEPNGKTDDLCDAENFNHSNTRTACWALADAMADKMWMHQGTSDRYDCAGKEYVRMARVLRHLHKQSNTSVTARVEFRLRRHEYHPYGDDGE